MRIITIAITALFLISGCMQQPTKSLEPQIPTEEPKEVIEETCTIGWKCLDKYKKGYQFQDCAFTQVQVCSNGCKDGECLPELDEEENEKAFTLTKGMDRLEEIGWKSCDFSEQEIFEDGVTNQDFKIKLYARALGYTYFRVESQEASIWSIDKSIADATRSDCIGRIKDKQNYNYLRTKKTLCIQTKERNIALIGGYWGGSPAEDTKLHWKYYS